MRKRQRIISFLLCICMLLSIAAVGSFSGSAAEASAETVAAAFDASHPELAQDTVRGSAILHCFCWSYDTIRENLADIKEAGYTAIQTSPVQPPKDYNASYTNGKDNWWKLYQPLDLAVTNGTNYKSWLGNKSQFTQMCTAAESYGIKVIVDIVSNHLANNGTSDGSFGSLHSDVNPEFNNQSYFYVKSDGSSYGGNSSSSRFQMTHGHLGMPELNTGNSFIQNKVLNLMKECVDCGADGFRFDTAKHIELPTDDSITKSNFWPTIINGINEYQAEKNGDPLYIYGEILGDAYSKEINKQYIQYMDLTDDYTCYIARHAVKDNNADGLHASYYQKGISANQAVLWAESHDTYMNAANEGGDTRGDSLDTIVKTWAMINSRADATSLFFVRPGVMENDVLTNAEMGSAGTDTTWKSTPVVESNKFKNLFAGQSEYLSYNSSYKAAYNERGTKGMVIVKTNGGGSVSLTVHRLADGTYRDHVSGADFTVTNGVITGNINSSGVAVIYNEGDTAEPHITASTLYLKPEYQYWHLGNERYAMYVFNNSTGQWVNMSDADGDGIYQADVPEGTWKGVIFCRMNGSISENRWNKSTDTDETKPVWNQTVDLLPTDTNNLFTVTGKDSNEDKKYNGTWSCFDGVADDTPTLVTDNTLYLDCSDVKTSQNVHWWVNDGALSYAYFFNNTTDTNQWVRMSAVDNETYIFKVTIPAGTWPNVIFTRMNPENIDTVPNKWSNKWNQTDDLTVPPASSESRCFKLKNEKVPNTEKQDGDWVQYPSHTFTPAWVWSSNNAAATLTLSCSCGRTLTFEKSVTFVSDDDKDVYTASVHYGGQEYTDTKTVYKRPTFEGHSVTVDGKIGLYFYVDLHQFTANPTISFTCNDSTTTAALVESESGQYRAAYYVAPKEMGDTITATVNAGNKTNTESYSVKQYLVSVVRNENGEAGTQKPAQLQALARSMLNYGAKAQLQFNYKTGDYDLVDYGLDSYTPASPSEISKISYTKDQFAAFGVSFSGSSLLLNDDTTLRLFFKKTESFSSAPTLSCNGNVLSQGTKGEYLTYDLAFIPAPNVLDTHSVAISNGTNSTTGSFTIRNYILNNYSKEGTLGDVVTALYDYSVKSSAYLY